MIFGSKDTPSNFREIKLRKENHRLTQLLLQKRLKTRQAKPAIILRGAVKMAEDYYFMPAFKNVVYRAYSRFKALRAGWIFVFNVEINP